MVKTLIINNRSTNDFVKDDSLIDSMRFIFAPDVTIIESFRGGVKVKENSIPSQILKEYAENVFTFKDGDRITFLNGQDFVGSLSSWEDVQIIESLNFNLQSRGIGCEDEKNYFLITSNLGNFEVNEDEYILFLYHARSIITNLRYSFDNVYHPGEADGVNTFSRVENWVNPNKPPKFPNRRNIKK